MSHPDRPATQSILMFHGVGQVVPGLPEEEPPYWITIEAFDEIVAMVGRQTSSPDVVWTFDDGNASDMLV